MITYIKASDGADVRVNHEPCSAAAFQRLARSLRRISDDLRSLDDQKLQRIKRRSAARFAREEKRLSQRR